MDDLNSRAALLDAVRNLQVDLDAVIARVDEERAGEPETIGEWSFKDLIAHLTGWRLLTAARLEAGWHHEEPVFPWPARFDEEEDLHEINRWLFEANRDKPLDQVLRESNETFDRLERAISEMPEDDLLKPGRFDWLYWTEEGLGPAVVRGTVEHYHVEHEHDVVAWLGSD